MKYDAFEVHPVAEYEGGKGGKFCEPCEREEAHFWSVYGHLPEGGVECLADFKQEKDAEYLCDMLTHGLRVAELVRGIEQLLPYAENEAHSLDALGSDEESVKAEAEEAWNAIEVVRLLVSSLRVKKS